MIVAIAVSGGVAAVIIGLAVSRYIWRNERFDFTFSLTTRSKVKWTSPRLLFRLNLKTPFAGLQAMVSFKRGFIF